MALLRKANSSDQQQKFKPATKGGERTREKMPFVSGHGEGGVDNWQGAFCRVLRGLRRFRAVFWLSRCVVLIRVLTGFTTICSNALPRCFINYPPETTPTYTTELIEEPNTLRPRSHYHVCLDKNESFAPIRPGPSQSHCALQLQQLPTET